MIRAYPGRPSVRAGETLTLHVAGDEPRFRIAIYRWEDGLVPVRVGAWLRAEHLPDGRADEDWQWPPYQVETGNDWPSGVSLAHLELPQGQPLRLSADSAAALFVVRARASKTILYKLPVATWHAYNCAGGACFYTKPPRSADPPGARFSLRRPGGGIGECDGVPVDRLGPDGAAILSAWRDETGTPDGYQLLAACPPDRRWQELPPRERHGAGEGVHVAAMGSFRRGGTVFSAGTTDWAQVLDDARDRKVERITRSVLDRLGGAREGPTTRPEQGAAAETAGWYGKQP